MASDQYHIPSYEQQLDTQLAEEVNASYADISDIQELHEQLSFYDEVKEIERSLDQDLRPNATEATLPKTSAVDSARAAIKSLLERL